MRNLLGHWLDEVASILRNKRFDPIVVIVIQDQVLGVADNQAVETVDLGPFQSARRDPKLRKAEVRLRPGQPDIRNDARIARSGAKGTMRSAC
jgi:hypothetical protein